MLIQQQRIVDLRPRRQNRCRLHLASAQPAGTMTGRAVPDEPAVQSIENRPNSPTAETLQTWRAQILVQLFVHEQKTVGELIHLMHSPPGYIADEQPFKAEFLRDLQQTGTLRFVGTFRDSGVVCKLTAAERERQSHRDVL